MGSAVLGAILWFIAIGVGEFILFTTFLLGSAAIAERTGKTGIVILGTVLGWLTAVAWFIFAGFHCIMHIVVIIQLILE